MQAQYASSAMAMIPNGPYQQQQSQQQLGQPMMQQQMQQGYGIFGLSPLQLQQMILMQMQMSQFQGNPVVGQAADQVRAKTFRLDTCNVGQQS